MINNDRTLRIFLHFCFIFTLENYFFYEITLHNNIASKIVLKN